MKRREKREKNRRRGEGEGEGEADIPISSPIKIGLLYRLAFVDKLYIVIIIS